MFHKAEAIQLPMAEQSHGLSLVDDGIVHKGLVMQCVVSNFVQGTVFDGWEGGAKQIFDKAIEVCLCRGEGTKVNHHSRMLNEFGSKPAVSTRSVCVRAHRRG